MAQQFPQDNSYYQPVPAPAPARKRPGAASVIGTLLLILAIAVILNEGLLKIRDVSVVGNQRISWEEVVACAGLERAVGYFTLNETKIARGVETNRYLIYEKMEKHFPNALTIYVKEREICARVQEMGKTYFLADDGMVLEKKENIQCDDEDNALLVVTGLKPKEMRVGRIMTAGTTDHMHAYCQLLYELQQQGYLEEISELNVTDPDSLYLITRDGYTAHLGDIEDVRAKIGTVRAVVARLREMGKKNGILEASIPGEVIYTPTSP